MDKEYMVIGFGKSKEKGLPYSRACRVVTDRDGNYGFLDMKDVYYTSDLRPLGTSIFVAVTEV